MSPEMADSGILEASEYIGKGLTSFAIRSAYQNETIYISSYEHFVTVFISYIPCPPYLLATNWMKKPNAILI